MDIQIKILCPNRKCGKCLRMIHRVEESVQLSDIEAEIEIIDNIDEMLNYRTWILPTLVINGNVVARGYVPSMERMNELLVLNK